MGAVLIGKDHMAPLGRGVVDGAVLEYRIRYQFCLCSKLCTPEPGVQHRQNVFIKFCQIDPLQFSFDILLLHLCIRIAEHPKVSDILG